MRRNGRIAATLVAVLAICVCALPAGAKSASDDEIKVRRVEIMLDSITVRVNQNRTLYAIISPSDAEDQSIAWESSNWEVAAVDGEGIITGVSPGVAEITATSANGKVGRCTVTVPGTAIQSDVYIPDVENGDNTQSLITAGERLTAAALRVDVEKAIRNAGQGEAGRVVYTDKTTVSSAALRGAAYTADTLNSNMRIQFQTQDAEGAIQGQLTVNPADAPAEDYDLKVAVYTARDKTSDLRSQAQARFGENIAVVRTGQQDSFGMAVRIAAKLHLSGTGNWSVYRYDGGEYTRLEDADVRMDSGGYLHFSTRYGGAFIIVPE